MADTIFNVVLALLVSGSVAAQMVLWGMYKDCVRGIGYVMEDIDRLEEKVSLATGDITEKRIVSGAIIFDQER